MPNDDMYQPGVCGLILVFEGLKQQQQQQKKAINDTYLTAK